MAIRVALDTKVLVYAEGVDRAPEDAAKIALSRTLLVGFRRAFQRPVMASQTLAELHRLLVRIGRQSPERASETVRKWQAAGETALLTSEGFNAALGLAADHELQIFDAMILASAVGAECDLIVSEELQDGFSWRGLTVTNLFGAKPDPRLQHFISAPP